MKGEQGWGEVALCSWMPYSSPAKGHFNENSLTICFSDLIAKRERSAIGMFSHVDEKWNGFAAY
jgi:hypothetical protein